MRYLIMSKKIQISLFIVFSFLICYVFVDWYYNYVSSNNSDQIFKDTVSTTITITSNLLTLFATFIALILYQDWRESLTANNRSDHAKNVQHNLTELNVYLNFYRDFILMHSGLGFEKQYVKDASIHYENLLSEYNQLIKKFQISLKIYEINYLKSKFLMNEDQFQQLQSYYYTITNNLNLISEQKHFDNDFQSNGIETMKKYEATFLEVKILINDELQSHIKLK